MILKSLKLKNIRSYEDMELEFPSGTVLLSGDIGSEKQPFCLTSLRSFGLQPGKKENSILRQGTEDAYV
jgi:DNA repair ATPase RecN